MKYLILARHGGPFWRHEVVKIVENATLEEAQAKAREIEVLNKDMFKDIEVTLFAGDYAQVAHPVEHCLKSKR